MDRRGRKLKFNVTRSWCTRFQLDRRNCKGPTVAPISKVAPGSKVNALPTPIGTQTISHEIHATVLPRHRSKCPDDFSPTTARVTTDLAPIVRTNRRSITRYVAIADNPIDSTVHHSLTTLSLRDTCRFLLDFSPS